MSDNRDEVWQSLESRYEMTGRKPEALVPADKPPPDRIKTHRGERRSHLMLDLQFKGGDSLGLAYSYLVAIKFNQSTGIDLEFSGHRVHIQGRGLAALYRGLLEHVVGQISECDVMADVADENRPTMAVYSIKVDST